MPRINSLTLLGIVYSFVVFGHGEHEPNISSANMKVKRRRRKTPLELFQIADSGVRERKKAAQAQKENLIKLNAFDIDIEENDSKSKLIPDKIKEQSTLISFQSENRGIIGPKKGQAGEHSNEKGNNHSGNDNEIREYSVVQKINEMVKKRQQKEVVEAEALMKMLLISDGFSMDMSMSMPSANVPSELDTIERSIINNDLLPVSSEESRSSINLSKPPSTVEVITDEGVPSSSQPDSQITGGLPDVNGDLPDNTDPSLPPLSLPPGPSAPGGEVGNGVAVSAIKGDGINSSIDGAESNSSASFPTLTVVSIVLSVMGFLLH